MTSYAHDTAVAKLALYAPSLSSSAVKWIAEDFEAVAAESTEGVFDSWHTYLRDIGGYQNFPSYAEGRPWS